MAAETVRPAELHRAGGGAMLVLTIVGSAVLCGVGLLGAFYWLLTLKWIFFLSFGALTVGAYLLFTRATGTDHA